MTVEKTSRRVRRVWCASRSTGTSVGEAGRHLPHRQGASHATSLVRRSEDIHVVQRLTSYSNLATTTRYLHLPAVDSSPPSIGPYQKMRGAPEFALDGTTAEPAASVVLYPGAPGRVLVPARSRSLLTDRHNRLSGSSRKGVFHGRGACGQPHARAGRVTAHTPRDESASPFRVVAQFRARAGGRNGKWRRPAP